MHATAASAKPRRAMDTGNKLKLGYFGQNCSSGRYVTLAEERWTAAWDENVRASILADEGGFDFLLPIGRWKGYGGATDYAGTSYETITWATGLLAVTKRIHVFGTVHAPLFHPVMAAKQMVTADHVGHGRFGLNIVAGWNEDEFAMFGIAQKDHGGRYAQAQEWIEVLKRIWSEDDFDYHGQYYDLTGVREKPKPYGESDPIIMNAGTSDDGRAFALRNCDALFTAAKYDFDDESMARAAREVATLQAAARDLGREIDVFTNGTAICRATRAEAEEYHHYLCVERADWEAIDNMLRMRGLLKDVTAEEHAKLRRRYAMVSGGFTLIGSPDDIAGYLERISAAGFTGIGLTSPHYENEFRWFDGEILPRLERKGLRRAR